jgi:predicted  nucleic acid-binding Zn-ribbon protein
MDELQDLRKRIEHAESTLQRKILQRNEENAAFGELLGKLEQKSARNETTLSHLRTDLADAEHLHSELIDMIGALLPALEEEIEQIGEEATSEMAAMARDLLEG